MIATRIHANFAAVLGASLFLSGSTSPTFRAFLSEYASGYDALNVEAFTLDAKERLRAVGTLAQLKEQGGFFSREREAMKAFERNALAGDDRLLYDMVADEIDFNIERVALEEGWVEAGRPMPLHGLFDMPDHERWYALFVRRFTGADITPEQVFLLGERETARCLSEIDKIRLELGFGDSMSFLKHLRDERFFITDRDEVLTGFALIDSAVRKNLAAFVDVGDLPVVDAQAWPDPGPNTPPGMYVPREGSGAEHDRFWINFHGGRYNSRAMTWIYMHEAIPGHHLQASTRRANPSNDLRDQRFHPGNAEGWGCYVEYYGDAFGVFTDPYQRLGKWEWDLVRSVRLVLDAGIHDRGWTREQALDYWKAHIPGQDDIAEREVTRVTNWAAQALSYKVGADRIQRMREAMEHKFDARFSAARFHRAYLAMGQVPISVAERNISDWMDR